MKRSRHGHPPRHSAEERPERHARKVLRAAAAVAAAALFSPPSSRPTPHLEAAAGPPLPSRSRHPREGSALLEARKTRVGRPLRVAVAGAGATAAAAAAPGLPRRPRRRSSTAAGLPAPRPVEGRRRRRRRAWGVRVLRLSHQEDALRSGRGPPVGTGKRRRRRRRRRARKRRGRAWLCYAPAGLCCVWSFEGVRRLKQRCCKFAR